MVIPVDHCVDDVVDDIVDDVLSFELPRDDAIALRVTATRRDKAHTSCARQLTSSSSQRLTLADNADISHGDRDFSYTGFVYFDTNSSNETILAKRGGGGNEIFLYILGAPDTIRLLIDGPSQSLIDTPNIAAVSTWIFFYAYHDSVNDEIGISFNDGTPSTTAHTTGVNDGTAPFEVGSQSGGTLFMNGRTARFGRWNRILTAAEITRMYNGGNGRFYSELNAAEKVDLVAYWNMNEASGNALDSHTNGYDLTDTNSVTANNGPRVETVEDSSGNGNHGQIEGMGAAEPSAWTSDAPSGKEMSLTLDGTDDRVNCGSVSEFDNLTAATLCGWVKQTVAGAQDGFFGTFSASDGLAIYAAGGVLYCDAHDGPGGMFGSVTITGYIGNNEWHHYTMLFDGSRAEEEDRIRFFLDGVEITLAYNYPIPTSLGTLPEFWIGDKNSAGYELAGKVCDVRVYDVAKTEAEILAIFQGTDDRDDIAGHWAFDDGPQAVTSIEDGDPVSVVTDLSDNEYTIAVDVASERPTFDVGEMRKTAFAFNGVDERFLSALATLAQPMTILVALKLDATLAADGYVVDGTPTNSVALFWDDSETAFSLDAGGTAIIATGSLDERCVVAAVVDGASSSLSVNAGTPTTGNPGANSLDMIVIGADTAESLFLHGAIAELIIYDEALDDVDLDDAIAYLRSQHV